MRFQFFLLVYSIQLTFYFRESFMICPMNYRLLFIVAAFLTLGSSLFAQEDFQKWLQKDSDDFNEFLSKEDKQFIAFLSESWKEYKLDNGIENDKNPKPLNLPPADKLDIELLEKLNTNLSANDKNKRPVVNVNLMPTSPKNIFPKEKKIGMNIIQTDFYNLILDWELPAEFIITTRKILQEEDFGKFWEEVSSLEYDILLNQLIEYKQNLYLNDWGYLLLINNFSNKISSSSDDIKELLNWFFLVKSGYKAKAGFINKKVSLFIPSENKIYKLPFFRTDNEYVKLYVVSLEGQVNKVDGGIITYDHDYPGAEKIFDLNIFSAPQLGEKVYNKELKFNYDKEEYTLTVACNKSLIDFYEFYPNTNLEIYFNSSVEYGTGKTLLNSLVNIIKEKPEPVAVNILLRFVQTAFGYKTDRENFNREKPLFKEETIFYENSDCEDRAVLFSYLVKELLGLEVIGLDYPGHVSTAVKFNLDIPGDHINYKNDKYTICDPTYVGAYIGLGMPQLKNVELENIIELTKK